MTPPAAHLDLDARTLQPHPDDDALRFPDGEVYVQLDLSGVDEAAVVHAGAPDPNAGMMQLYGVLERLDEEDIPAEVAFTYMPYSRQDAAFAPGTLNRARAILRRLVDCHGVRAVHAVDSHFSHRAWVDDLPFHGVSALPLLQDRVEMEDVVVVGPDPGAGRRFGVDAFAKERSGAETVDVEGELDVDGRNVLVVDDIIATGGTMTDAYEKLRAQGAGRVEAAAVHGVLADGVEQVADMYDALHLANTVDRVQADTAVEPLLHEALDL
ncbi:MAG: ribose-phosphate diphosphokinase [Candidatus Nanohaloarchaea archaeon]|nr:ribose-phosphate diphosphokinase [Candidatus Nanohaloarchaea archaeon]